ncbi:hypothetical protein [Salisediminibacterium beveridgei]|uniref:Uncharacterized protein n=1 Tax=Salisediminibacterium beveridgei TaxID=632773 RepID=A0A1D7QZG9_9BACI|nr:hypothetical protein [Salisediminibacterium beveridgei]AOM84405.1 hypothetical protein BBEV_3088 [Salisediminibacterium beveridgei]
MVITDNMPVSGIVDSWPETTAVLDRYKIPTDSNQPLFHFVQCDALTTMLSELNHIIGSSSVTCIDGG